jgi:hypothetical protein
MGRLHTQAFWVYGVIVALAIREGLTRTIPHVVFQTTDPSWMLRLETWRLLIFLLMIIRFYLGGSIYFDKVYINEITSARIKKKNYGIDFSSGMIMFIIFFGLSISITDHTRLQHGMSNFLWIVAAILFYDLIWLSANILNDTVRHIRLWAVINFLTLVLAALLFFLIREARGDVVLAEEWALSIIALISVLDYVEMMSATPIFAPVLNKISTSDEVSDQD